MYFSLQLKKTTRKFISVFSVLHYMPFGRQAFKGNDVLVHSCCILVQMYWCVNII